MNISFRSNLVFNPELFDFLMVLLKPRKILPPKEFVKEAKIEGARLISIEELRRELSQWAKKHQNTTFLGLEVLEIELTQEERKKINSVVFFEKVGH